MLLNILTGRNGVTLREPQEIVVLVTSLHTLASRSMPFVFTDRHAFSAIAQFFSDSNETHRLRWPLLQTSDFSRDKEDPGKLECYQAEALVHRRLPVEALQGVGCYNDHVREEVQNTIAQAGASLKAVTRRGWYFR